MGTFRVHELAKEFGVASIVLLSKLKEMGAFVKSASSIVEKSWEHRLREAFAETQYVSAKTWAVPPVRPDTAFAIETAAAEARAAALRAERESAVKAAPMAAVPAVRPDTAFAIETAAAEARAAALRAERESSAVTTEAGRPTWVASRPVGAIDRHLNSASGWQAEQVAEVLVLWDKLSALAPIPDRCVDHLAAQGGVPRSDVHRLRTVRNRCAHPAEKWVAE